MAEDNKVPGFSQLTLNVPGVKILFNISACGKSGLPFANNKLIAIFGIQPEAVNHNARPVFNKTYALGSDQLNLSVGQSAQFWKDWEHEFRIIPDESTNKWLRGFAGPENNSAKVLYGVATFLILQKDRHLNK